MPILPLVLVNGSSGIGTGWSTSIPNYNPRDIVANLRRLMNGEEMKPMDPWYKGFKGEIKMEEKKKSYTVMGNIQQISPTSLSITFVSFFFFFYFSFYLLRVW